MDAATFWLARSGLDQALFTLAQARALQDQLPADAGLLDFAQQLSDDGFDENVVLFERITALTRRRQRPPAGDP